MNKQLPCVCSSMFRVASTTWQAVQMVSFVGLLGLGRRAAMMYLRTSLFWHFLIAGVRATGL